MLRKKDNTIFHNELRLFLEFFPEDWLIGRSLIEKQFARIKIVFPEFVGYSIYSKKPQWDLNSNEFKKNDETGKFFVTYIVAFAN